MLGTEVLIFEVLGSESVNQRVFGVNHAICIQT